MAQYDGSIRINTKIDSKEASAQLITLENRIKKTADKVASLRSKMDELKKTKVPTQEYAELDKELGRLGAAYDKLAERQQRFLSTGGKEGSSAYKRMEYDLDALDVKQDKVISKMKQLESGGKAFTLGSDTEKFTNLGQQLKYAENDLAALNQKRSEIVGGNENLKQSYVSLSESIKNAFSVMANRIKHPFQTMKSIASSAIGATSKLLSGMVSVAKKSGSAISGIASTLKKATSAIFGLGNGAKKSGSMLSTFASRLKGIALSLLIFNWITKAFNAMVSGMKTGFSNFSGYSAEFANSVQSMKNAMSTLGNQAAAAFAPLVQAAIPMLVSLINTLTRATAAVAQFIAAITGKSTFKKATKVQEDYAGALGKTAGAAKNANKQLSSLDKLNNLTTNDGGGGGGGGGGGADYGDMFEDADVSSKIKDFADLIKKSWESADFTEVGAIIGKKLKEGLENIPWEEIQATAEKVGKSLATLINGFVEVDGLGYTIGKSIGEAINTGIKGINAFLDNTHWDSVGKFIGNGMNGIVDSIDWKSLGHMFAAKWNAIFKTIGNSARAFKWTDFGKKLATSLNTFIKDFKWEENGANLSDLAKGILDTIITFLEETNWQELGEKVADFIGAIDWTGIMERIAEGIGAALGGLAALIWGFIKDAWEKVVEWWKDKAFKDGKFTISGLLDGIIEGIKNIGKWIKEHIFKPFIDGFKKAFGISSSSKVMKEQGGYIISGLKQGIKEKWSEFKQYWSDKKKEIIDKFSDIKEKFLKKGREIIAGIKGGISEKWSDFKSYWSNKKEEIVNKFNDIKEKFLVKGRNIISGIKSGISEKWSEFISYWTDKKDSIVKKFDNIKDKFKAKGTSIISGIKSGISEKWSEFSSYWGDKRDSIVKKFDNIRTRMSSVGKNIINGIIDGIKSIWSTLSGWAKKIADLFTIDVKKSKSGGTKASSGGESAASVFSEKSANIYSGVPTFASAKIPALATGTVVPPNREFMALLGDNKREPEVVSPLSTIEQAVENAMRRNGGAGGGEITIKIPVEIDGRVLFELVKKFDLAQYQRTGKPSFQI